MRARTDVTIDVSRDGEPIRIAHTWTAASGPRAAVHLTGLALVGESSAQITARLRELADHIDAVEFTRDLVEAGS